MNDENKPAGEGAGSLPIESDGLNRSNEDNSHISVADKARAFLAHDYETAEQAAQAEQTESSEESNETPELAENEDTEAEVPASETPVEETAPNTAEEQAEPTAPSVEQAEAEQPTEDESSEDEAQQSTDPEEESSTEKENDAGEEKEDVSKAERKTAGQDTLKAIEETDFSSLNKEELLALIKKVSDRYALSIQGRTLGCIKDAFDVFANREKEDALARFIETGGVEADFYFRGGETNSRFYEHYNLLRKNRHEHFKNQEEERENNLKKKNELLVQLREVVDSEESTASLDELKAIQTAWRTVGQVPAAQNKTLWANYHALIDRFYDRRSIYFELKELDRRKNLEAKLAICQRAEDLDGQENSKDVIQKLNELHEDFRHIGPVPKDKKEEVWSRLKTASRRIHAKRREFFSHIKREQQKHLSKKKVLAAKVEEFAQFNSSKIKAWNTKTGEIVRLQKEWEGIGAMPKEQAKAVNKQFWKGFKGFFHNKAEFFRCLGAGRDENLKLKRDLVSQAEALMESTEWEKTAEILKGLQQKWRTIGPAPKRYNDSIYKSFIDACNAFFNKKRQHSHEGMDAEYVLNLQKKEEICAQLEEITKSKAVDRDVVHGLQHAFHETGFVPKKKITSIQNRYQSALDDLVKSADNLDAEAKREFELLINIHNLKSGPNADQKLYRRAYNLRRKITILEADLSTWKNNLDFFADSKDASELLAGFEDKIAQAERDLAELKKELKVIMTL